MAVRFRSQVGFIMVYGSYGRRSSLLLFLTGALIMLGSIGAVAALVSSRPASAEASLAQLAAAGCAECATVTGVKAVNIDRSAVLPTPLRGGAGDSGADGAPAQSREYHVTIRRDDGSTKTISQPAASWQVGDRVRLVEGRLHAIDAG